MTEDSLKKRYIFKLTSNIIGLIISLFTQAIIPRGLGPRAYGDFSFLSNFFNQVVGFFDMGTSIGFYTKLSQRQKETDIVVFYTWFAIATSLLLFLIVLVVSKTPFAVKIWPDQIDFYVYLSAIWGILMWYSQILTKIVDAYGLTVSGEMARNIQKILGLILIGILFFYDKLNLKNFFLPLCAVFISWNHFCLDYKKIQP